MQKQIRVEQATRARKSYRTPKLTALGNIEEITRMPGGSINAEGASGKPHQQ